MKKMMIAIAGLMIAGSLVAQTAKTTKTAASTPVKTEQKKVVKHKKATAPAKEAVAKKADSKPAAPVKK